MGETDAVAPLDIAATAETVATACQVMAERGLVEHVLGHISARVAPDHLLVRCRGPEEAGLAYTTSDDIRSVWLDGRADLGAWRAPNELPIHTEVMRRRPEVTAVVHAHPPAVVAASLLNDPLVPVYGAYDIPGARLAAGGIPQWQRSALVTTAELASDMADALGDRPVVLLRGHGLVSVASGPPATAIAQSVLQALAVDTLARTTLAVRSAGGIPVPISDADQEALPDLGGGFVVDTMWRHLTRRTIEWRYPGSRGEPPRLPSPWAGASA
jgi:ribulose-5-phosphate 4-epimerase/fuculose-1-phosphate aldolase